MYSYALLTLTFILKRGDPLGHLNALVFTKASLVVFNQYLVNRYILSIFDSEDIKA